MSTSGSSQENAASQSKGPSVFLSPKDAKDAFVEISRHPSPEEEHKDLFELDVQAKRHDVNARANYTKFARTITFVWIGFVMVLTFVQILVRAFGLSGLDASEFIAVVTTTTVSVLGLWGLVAKYLFPRS